MMRDIHGQARELIALGAKDLSEGQRQWLEAHLKECGACRDFDQAAGKVVHALRSLPVAADSRLVRATQMRVRFHARTLRETRERMWLIGILCAAVGFSTALTGPLLWELFAWIAGWAGIASPLWQAGFTFFCVAPVLVIGVVLLARGTHLATDGLHSWQRK